MASLEESCTMAEAMAFLRLLDLLVMSIISRSGG
jgi:hypothetical protein